MTSAANPLPISLQRNPDLDRWIRVNRDKTMTVFTGKVEIGQGIRTAIAQIAAEELDLRLGQVIVGPVDTENSPNEGVTAGSMSLETSGASIRITAAEARLTLLKLASEELEAQIEDLVVVEGVITDPNSGRRTDYWSLFAGKQFEIQVTGNAPLKDPDAHQIVGTTATRLDLLAKVTGQASFVHDLELPGMVYGRVVRPPTPGAMLISLNEGPARGKRGVLAVVRNGSFLGVIAEREEAAVWAAQQLGEAAVWEPGPALPAQEDVHLELERGVSRSDRIVAGVPVEGEIPDWAAPESAVQTRAATYERPFLMHASLAPSAGAALWDNGQLTVWSHSQGPYVLRGTIASVLGLAEGDVRVIHMEGAGCYGHNGADDAAFEAALLALEFSGRPVLLQWSRADEHGWEPYGPAMRMELRGALDASGAIVGWSHAVSSYPQTRRPHAAPGTSNFLAASLLEKPLPQTPPRLIDGFHGGIHRNADPLYEFPRQVVRHLNPDSPLRTSSLRGLGAYANVFAIESFMDELAYAAGADPVEFRLRHLRDEHGRAVIQAAAKAAVWEPRTGRQQDGDSGARSPKKGTGILSGRGIGYAQYKNQKTHAAVIVEVRVNRENGEIALIKAWIAADAGQIINPDGLRNQLEGGFVQSASWTLMEEVRFDKNGVTSLDWDTYPILRTPDVPPIETTLLNHPGTALRRRRGSFPGAHRRGHRQCRLQRHRAAAAKTSAHPETHAGGNDRKFGPQLKSGGPSGGKQGGNLLDIFLRLLYILARLTI